MLQCFCCRDSHKSDEPPTDYLITGGLDDLVKVWELIDDRLVLKHNLEGHSLGVVSVAMSSDGRSKIFISMIKKLIFNVTSFSLCF